jgi:hypothetical protein
MVNKYTFNTLEKGSAFTLKIWPFSISDFLNFVTSSIVKCPVFIAVANSVWDEGYHPPSAKQFSLKSRPRGTVAIFETKRSLIRFLKKAQTSPGFAVDLSLYFPARKIKKSQFDQLEGYFESFNHDNALGLWGGYWLKLHDTCKGAFITKPSTTVPRKLIAKILETSGARINPRQLQLLVNDIQTMKKSKCMVVSWFEWSVVWKCGSADLLRYEQLEKV